jgi:hypothetical protein
MRIRLTGTANECVAAAAIISAVLDVKAESAAYRHVGSSGFVQVYLCAQVLAQPDHNARKEAES